MNGNEKLARLMELDNPKQAYDEFRRISDKRLVIKHEGHLITPRLEISRDCTGFTIFINADTPTAEHSLVHELTHAAMFEEGYPCVYIRKEPFLSSEITNALQHPEVFRRMQENYQLDMEPYVKVYWGKIAADEIERLRRISNPRDVSDTITNQLNYHFIGGPLEASLVAFAEMYPKPYELSVELFEKAKSIGLDTPDKAHRFATYYMDQMYAYSSTHYPKDSRNEWWCDYTIMRCDELMVQVTVDQNNMASSLDPEDLGLKILEELQRKRDEEYRNTHPEDFGEWISPS